MHTSLSNHLGYKYLQTDHPEITVSALPVAVQVNVLEHLPPHGISRLEALTVDGFDFFSAHIINHYTLGPYTSTQVIYAESRNNVFTEKLTDVKSW